MARNRQRAKQRQAERRAARLGTRPEPLQGEDLLEEAELATGAPPADLGRSDAVVESESHDDDLDAEPGFETDEEEFDEVEEEQEARARGRARTDGSTAHGRRRHNRLVGFLIAVWAELQRVEWPDRQTLMMLTGVVLLFVIVMGAYLGLLDAIFSRLINKIL